MFLGQFSKYFTFQQHFANLELQTASFSRSRVSLCLWSLWSNYKKDQNRQFESCWRFPLLELPDNEIFNHFCCMLCSSLHSVNAVRYRVYDMKRHSSFLFFKHTFVVKKYSKVRNKQANWTYSSCSASQSILDKAQNDKFKKSLPKHSTHYFYKNFILYNYL